jgi:hypothetical protein
MKTMQFRRNTVRPRTKKPPREAASRKHCPGLLGVTNRDGGLYPSRSDARVRRGPYGRAHGHGSQEELPNYRYRQAMCPRLPGASPTRIVSALLRMRRRRRRSARNVSSHNSPAPRHRGREPMFRQSIGSVSNQAIADARGDGTGRMLATTKLVPILLLQKHVKSCQRG